MASRRTPGLDAQEAAALAFRFADGMQDTGASAEARAAAFVDHLRRNGYVVRPRIGGEGTRARRLPAGAAVLTAGEVRAARGRLGLSRLQLAEMAGISRDTLVDFENGRKVPQQRTLAALSVALARAARLASTPAQSGSP